MLPSADRLAPEKTWDRLTPQVYRREPLLDEDGRWSEHDFGGRRHLCAQPITFTPYAASAPCSARCRFCSENLELGGQGRRAAQLRPGERYFHWLQQALRVLRGLPLSYSLSGLETSDDPDWMLRMLELLDQAAKQGVPVENRVLYTNSAGFAGPRGAELVEALRRFRLSWVELSRHHQSTTINQRLMRFRPGIAVAEASSFMRTLQGLREASPVKLVCIVQQGGVSTAGGVREYLAWAAGQGASTVIFREFSQLTDDYRRNGTARYIDSARVSVEALLSECLVQPDLAASLQPLERTRGYYFHNLRLRHASGMEVVFEVSDYARMRQKHDSERVYKLVFFPDGKLCGDWHPQHKLLLDCADGQQ